MGIHSKVTINNLHSQLKERMDKLKKIMEGGEILEHEGRDYPFPDKMRKVNPSEIRVAADDFNTILKEIKRVLK